MITIKKLLSLNRNTRLRKMASLFLGFELDIRREDIPDISYIAHLLHILIDNDTINGAHQNKFADYLVTLEKKSDLQLLLRICNDARHAIYGELGIEPADWDLLPTEIIRLEHEPAELNAVRKPGPRKIYLDDLRSPFNIGSIFRTAESFGAEEIILSHASPKPSHPRAVRSSMGCVHIVPWRSLPVECLDEFEGVFALETGGTPIDSFDFPSRGLVIVGNEELGVSPNALQIAGRQSGKVSIPTTGFKGSLNVSVAFGILMHYWQSSQNSRTRQR
jgi:RNA methyltransferase, TrmH family